MVKSQTTSITPAQHAARHVIGGADPLIDPLLLHASRHESGGADAITVAHHDGTQIKNNFTVGLGWADLDLSAVIGSRRCLIGLTFQPTAGGGGMFTVRTKGETLEFQNSVLTGSSNNSTVSAVNVCAGVYVVSDAAGIIQWRNSGNMISNVNAWVEWFIPLG